MRKLLSILGIIFISYSLVVAVDYDDLEAENAKPIDEYANVRLKITTEIEKYCQCQSWDEPYPLNIEGIDMLILAIQSSLEADEKILTKLWIASDKPAGVEEKQTVAFIKALKKMFQWGYPRHLESFYLTENLPNSYYQTGRAMASLYYQLQIIFNTLGIQQFFDQKRNAFKGNERSIFKAFEERIRYRRRNQDLKRIYDTKIAPEKIIYQNFVALPNQVSIDMLCQFIDDGITWETRPKPEFFPTTETVSAASMTKLDSPCDDHDPATAAEPSGKRKAILKENLFVVPTVEESGPSSKRQNLASTSKGVQENIPIASTVSSHNSIIESGSASKLQKTDSPSESSQAYDPRTLGNLIKIVFECAVFEKAKPIRETVSGWNNSMKNGEMIDTNTLKDSLEKEILPWMRHTESFMTLFPVTGAARYVPVLKIVAEIYDFFQREGKKLPEPNFASPTFVTYRDLHRRLLMMSHFCHLQRKPAVTVRDIMEFFSCHGSDASWIQYYETMFKLYSDKKSAAMMLEENTEKFFELSARDENLINNVEQFVANNLKYEEMLRSGLANYPFMSSGHIRSEVGSYANVFHSDSECFQFLSESG